MKIKYIQFAKDYNFKEAWKVFPGQKIEQTEINNFLQPHNYKTLSFECFYELDDEYLIIGYSSEGLIEQKFVSDALVYLTDHNQLSAFQKRISTEIPAMARVGILDFWFETGPCLVWSSKSPQRITPESVVHALAAYPKIMNTTLNPQGTSFYFSKEMTGQEHWLMKQTSKSSNGIFTVDIENVVKLVNEMTNNILGA